MLRAYDLPRSSCPGIGASEVDDNVTLGKILLNGFNKESLQYIQEVFTDRRRHNNNNLIGNMAAI